MVVTNPQKLALTLPTGGGRSVGIVRSRTKATEFFFYGYYQISELFHPFKRTFIKLYNPKMPHE